jgi:isopentenyldiphosphate isomerase
VVNLNILNKNGGLFLQKRSKNKDIEPGKWDTSVGGHIGLDETIDKALQREAFEEIGLKNIETSFIKKYIWASHLEKELVYSFIGSSEDTPVLERNEIDEGKFWSLGEIRDNLGKGLFTPNFEYEFEMIYGTLLKLSRRKQSSP